MSVLANEMTLADLSEIVVPDMVPEDWEPLVMRILTPTGSAGTRVRGMQRLPRVGETMTGRATFPGPMERQRSWTILDGAGRRVWNEVPWRATTFRLAAGDSLVVDVALTLAADR